MVSHSIRVDVPPATARRLERWRRALMDRGADAFPPAIGDALRAWSVDAVGRPSAPGIGLVIEVALDALDAQAGGPPDGESG